MRRSALWSGCSRGFLASSCASFRPRPNGALRGKNSTPVCADFSAPLRSAPRSSTRRGGFDLFVRLSRPSIDGSARPRALGFPAPARHDAFVPQRSSRVRFRKDIPSLERNSPRSWRTKIGRARVQFYLPREIRTIATRAEVASRLRDVFPRSPLPCAQPASSGRLADSVFGICRKPGIARRPLRVSPSTNFQNLPANQCPRRTTACMFRRKQLPARGQFRIDIELATIHPERGPIARYRCLSGRR